MRKNSHSIFFSRAAIFPANRPPYSVVCLLIAGGLASAGFAQQDPTGVPPPSAHQGAGITVLDQKKDQSRPSDEDLVIGIKKALEADKHVPSYQIGIGAEDGNVTLSGTVSSLLAKERAAALAKTVAGVSELENQINVAVSPRKDWEIKTDVLNAFRNNKVLESYELDVPVHEGFVVLSGTVDSPQRKQLAELLAKAVPGVRGVENQLDVSYSTERSDEDILADVLSQISWDPWLQEPQLVVKVNGGIVNLSGFVSSQTARERAIRDAWVVGATEVNAQRLQVTESMRAAFMPPDAPLTARQKADDTADLEIQPGPLRNRSGATNAPELAVSQAKVAVTNVPEGVGAATIPDETPLQQTNATPLGNVLQNQTQTLTSAEAVLAAETPERFSGQRAHFMNATVRSVIGDRILMLGAVPGGPPLPVRLQEHHPEIQAGQVVEVNGIITQMPQSIRWLELTEQQKAEVRKAPVFLNAVNVRVRQAGTGTPNPQQPAP